MAEIYFVPCFSSGQNGFMLTPVSFIAINSMKVNNNQYNAKFSKPVNVSESYNVVPLDVISSGFISELIQCLECKPMQFHCRVSYDLMHCFISRLKFSPYLLLLIGVHILKQMMLVLFL